MKKKMTKEARAFLRELAEVKQENERLSRLDEDYEGLSRQDSKGI